MPFLRVVRDKRGYETTYLMHWYREGHRQHSRILYVFRSPGGVRVGRDPLDPEVLRQLETQHPDIAFDWKVVRENQQVVETTPEPRRRRPTRQEDGDPPAPPSPPPPSVDLPGPTARPPVPARIEGDTPDEQIAFLAQWYVTIRERIPQRTADAARQETLVALVEQLNPASWSDADQMTTGLQLAADALERLSQVFARRRRRSRKKARSAPDAAGAASPEPVSIESDERDDPDATASPDSDEGSPLE